MKDLQFQINTHMYIGLLISSWTGVSVFIHIYVYQKSIHEDHQVDLKEVVSIGNRPEFGNEEAQ